MKKTVVVVMSTYNGGENIVRQLDSIFNQEGVNVKVFIRDDSSSDNTVEIIEKYIMDHPKKELNYIVGKNEGYARSFFDALCLAGTADYYAFSDQDDVWKKEKLISLIQSMEICDSDEPKLAYCKMSRTDEKLNRQDEQVHIIVPSKLNKKLCLTQTYNYGAATVFNKKCKDLICRHCPESKEVPHDLWAGLLCYWFGKVFFVVEELYYWIRYNSSVTGEGTKKSGRNHRIKETLQKKSYPNVAMDLLQSYDDLLLSEDKRFLQSIVNYRHCFTDKMKLVFDVKFRRDKLWGTIMLKLGILMNWF